MFIDFIIPGSIQLFKTVQNAQRAMCRNVLDWWHLYNPGIMLVLWHQNYGIIVEKHNYQGDSRFDVGQKTICSLVSSACYIVVPDPFAAFLAKVVPIQH